MNIDVTDHKKCPFLNSYILNSCNLFNEDCIYIECDPNSDTEEVIFAGHFCQRQKVKQLIINIELGEPTVNEIKE